MKVFNNVFKQFQNLKRVTKMFKISQFNKQISLNVTNQNSKT